MAMSSKRSDCDWKRNNHSTNRIHLNAPGALSNLYIGKAVIRDG
jgi:hypothetical protein